MANNIFYYNKKSEALFDLKLFSRQHMNEGKTLYLFSTSQSKFWICKEIAPTITTDMVVEAIAINGTVYTPSDD